MNKVLPYFLFCITLACNNYIRNNSFLKLWYNHPANKGLEKFPAGNGRTGAIIFGGTSQEQIRLNESIVWAESLYYNANPVALKALPEIRKLIFDWDFKLREAKGKNPKPFFVVPHIIKPLIFSEVKIKPVKSKKILFDFQTEAGKEYPLVLSD